MMLPPLRYDGSFLAAFTVDGILRFYVLELKTTYLRRYGYEAML